MARDERVFSDEDFENLKKLSRVGVTLDFPALIARLQAAERMAPAIQQVLDLQQGHFDWAFDDLKETLEAWRRAAGKGVK